MLKEIVEKIDVREGERVAVGVSGGADSMVLLSALWRAQKKTPYYLHAIHVNHHLRGEESDADASFVEKFCIKNKIPYSVLDVDVKGLKSKDKLTLEEAARAERYRAINREMRDKKLGKLFLAHHKNDQAETILMHIFRGSGISGAAGIKQNGKICRPLLSYKKSEILDIAHENKIPFVSDKSNDDTAFTRNYVRAVIIPAIEKAYPNVVDALSQFGQRCEEVDEFLKRQVDARLISLNKSEVTLSDEIFRQDPILIHQYLKLAFEKLEVFADIEAKHYQMLIDLVALPVGSTINLPHKLVAKRSYYSIALYVPRQTQKPKEVHEFVVGEIDFGGLKISAQVVDYAEIEYGDGNLYFDYYKLPGNAVWRFRRLGDRFSKLGTGSKKLNDYFTDKKVDADKRDHIPILSANDEVLVVLGYDISEKIKIDPSSEKFIKISCKII